MPNAKTSRYLRCMQLQITWLHYTRARSAPLSVFFFGNGKCGPWTDVCYSVVFSFQYTRLPITDFSPVCLAMILLKGRQVRNTVGPGFEFLQFPRIFFDHVQVSKPACTCSNLPKVMGAVSHLKNRYKGQEVTSLKTIFVQI